MADCLDKPKVLASFNEPGGAHCVDIFVRANQTYGFELYRRDVEDGGAWQCLHRFGSHCLDSGQRALDAARGSVPWLQDPGPWRW